MAKKKTLVTISLVCSILVIVGIGILWSIVIEMEKDRKMGLGIDDIEIKEREFAENPDIQLALTLMDRYRFVESIKDLDKAEFYGKKAIELGANEKKGAGFFANFYLAFVYYEKGDDIKACLYFLKAKELRTIEIERQNILSKEVLEQEFDGKFIENCQELEKQAKKSSPTS